MSKVLVIAAHPDDEVLGVGGTILKHAQQGDQVDLLVLGEGVTSRGDGQEMIEAKAKTAREVAKALGIHTLILKRLPDQKFDTLPLLDITKQIEEVIEMLQPEIVYTQAANDLNLDHRIIFEAVLTACRPQPNFCVKQLLTFESLSSTEWQVKEPAKMFCPNYYNDITKFMAKKLEVLKIYQDELRAYPHPRSMAGVKILAAYRGMEVGYRYAEAFQTVRILND